MIAVKCGKEKLVDCLIHRGCSIEHVNHEGDTALHLALSLGFKICSAMLLANGANEIVENNNRQTPWQMDSQLT